MGELGDLLELIQGAARSFASARGVAVSETHLARQDELRRRFVDARGGTATQRLVAKGPAVARPATSQRTTRFWVQRPDRVREETAGDEEPPHLLVQVGATWWSHTERHGAMTNEGSPNHAHGRS